VPWAPDPLVFTVGGITHVNVNPGVAVNGNAGASSSAA
jgi:hypothetical protein